MQWVVASVVLSVVLTVLMNVALRLFPDLTGRVARSIDDRSTPNHDAQGTNERRVRVSVPWKAMILGSLILTVVINVVLRLA